MTEATLWTLDELVQLAGRALSVDYEGAPSARVRDLPARRLVRWYVTRGLVDRPTATNGRHALYGRRHLLQLVAIKRLQARGRSLAEIQAELVGASDSTLERLARVATVSTADVAARGSQRAEAQTDGSPIAESQAARPQLAGPQPVETSAPVRNLRTRFWVARPAGPEVDAERPRPGPGVPGLPAPGIDEPMPSARTSWPLRAIELSPGITLLVDPARTLDADPDAVRIAAQALLDLLAPSTVPATTDERSTP